MNYKSAINLPFAITNLNVEKYQNLWKKFNQSQLNDFLKLRENINQKNVYGKTLFFKNAWNDLKFGFLHKTDNYLKKYKFLLQLGTVSNIKDWKKRNVYKLLCTSKSQVNEYLQKVLFNYDQSKQNIK